MRTYSIVTMHRWLHNSVKSPDESEEEFLKHKDDDEGVVMYRHMAASEPRQLLWFDCDTGCVLSEEEVQMLAKVSKEDRRKYIKEKMEGYIKQEAKKFATERVATK